MRRTALFALLAASLLSHPAAREAVLSLLSSAWSAASVDEGCILDPSGHCRPSSPTIDEGCILDPDGRPACGAQGS